MAVVDVQDLAGEDGPPERGPEDRADAAGGTRQDEHPTLAGGEAEQPGQDRPESGADLRDRPFLAGRSAAADGQDRGDPLDQRDAAADDPSPAVEGPDHGVGAVPLGLGGQGEDEQARGQPAEGRDQQDHPPRARAR